MEQELDDWMLAHGLKPLAQEITIHKYIVSWYFINTIFSTVGFGDISAENQLERAYLVVCPHLLASPS